MAGGHHHRASISLLHTPTLVSLRNRAETTAVFMLFDKDGAKHQNLQFLTVTVGDFWFEPNRVTYIAVAVQNVATVSIAPDQMRLFQTVGLGDKFYLKTKMSATDTMLPFKMFKAAGKNTTADPALQQDHYVRVLTAVAPPIGNTIRCDMGNMLLVQ